MCHDSTDLVNLDAGARSRLAAIIGSLTILAIILVGAPIIEQIPLAALVGVMMIVAITTFKWVSFQLVTRMPKADIFVLFLVTIIIVVTHNLALAVLIGVIVSALVFAWDNAIRIRARKSFDTHGNKVYAIYGPLFFGSTTSFIEKFTPLTDTPVVYIDFKESRIVDMSAIETLKKLIDKYQEQNKQILLINVTAESKRLLINSKLFNSNLLENN